MRITGVISLSEPWSDKTAAQLVLKNAGIYVGNKSGHMKSELGGEIKWNLLNSNYVVYSVDAGRNEFKPATLTDALNKEVYVLTIGDLVRTVFFVK